MEDKRNLYYRLVICRGRHELKPPGRVFLFLSAHARLLLEVFTRKDFGERYFSLISAAFFALFLGIWPVLNSFIPSFSSAPSHLMSNILNVQGGDDSFSQATSQWVPYIGWYAFLLAFLFMSLLHESQIKRSYDTFDFSKYSLDDGASNPVFAKFISRFGEPNPRMIACVLEPLPFFVAGILLSLIGQSVGWLLILSSIFYSLGYRAEYALGRNFVLDKIDEMLCAEEMAEAFSKPNPKRKNNIIKLPPPSSMEQSQKLRPLLLGEDEIAFAK